MKIGKVFFSTKYFPRGNNVRNIKKDRVSNHGIQRRLKLYENSEFEYNAKEKDEYEGFLEDTDFLESDFMDVGKSYNMHNRELKANKEILKNRITFDKYIKETEPSFLTFAEKEQIKLLHEKDPHEWDIEKLSESFPALPHTIKKVLRAKWKPKSQDDVLKYDEKVINNWEAFHAGELSLSQDLKKHLEKFNNREIILTNRDKLVDIVPPTKIELETKSKLFTTIAETFLLNNSKTESVVNDMNSEILDKTLSKETNFSTLEKDKNLLLRRFEKGNVSCQRSTFDEFLKRSVSCAQNPMSPENIVLKETYKKEMEKMVIFQSKPAMSPTINKLESVETSRKEEIKLKSEVLISKTEKDVSALVTEIELNNSLKPQFHQMSSKTDERGLDTYVKEWYKNNTIDCHVEYRIKIPAYAYKEGMTYRVRDCFYDDDGEFLYKVPGLLN